MRMTRTIATAAVAFALAAVLQVPALAGGSSTQLDMSVDQQNHANHTGGSGANQASISDWAFYNTKGNIGVNVASGNTNQQANIAFIDNGSPTFAFSGEFSQETTNEDLGSLFSGLNNAEISDNAFYNAQGNIGVNVASGDQNSQVNGLAVLDKSSSVELQIDQKEFDTNGSVSGLNSGDIEDNAFYNASGNIGVNVASGNLNQQANAAVVTQLTKMRKTHDDEMEGVSFSIDQEAAANLNILSGANEAEIEDHAFYNASGNIGVNLAAGNGNQQANALIVIEK